MADMDHAVLVGFDGLRADLVTPEAAPHLAALAAEGATLPRHRAAFPTETRVNLASLVTGGSAADHGVASNRFLVPSLAPDAALNTGALADLQRLDGHAGRPLLGLPHLGDHLAAAGRTLAVLHTGSEGSCSILGWAARDHSRHFVFNPLHPGAGRPADRAQAIRRRYGIDRNGPPEDVPRCITDIFLDAVWPELRPAVSILWFAEPDSASHDHGPGAPGHLAAVRHVDAQLGRLMDWRSSQPDRDRIGLAVVSDHGHVTLGEPVSVIDTLYQAGLKVDDHLAGDADLAVIAGLSPGIWARDGDVGRLQAAFDVLSEQPWFGVAFSHGRGDGPEGVVRGTLAHDVVQAGHPRSPHLRITYRGDDRPNAHGLIGMAPSDTRLSELERGGGHHGSLHLKELESVLIAHGAAFRSGHHDAVWSGSADITPTLLTALGLPAPNGGNGRILHEILMRSDRSSAPAPAPEEITHKVGGTVHRLRRVCVGDTVYLDGVVTA